MTLLQKQASPQPTHIIPRLSTGTVSPPRQRERDVIMPATAFSLPPFSSTNRLHPGCTPGFSATLISAVLLQLPRALFAAHSTRPSSPPAHVTRTLRSFQTPSRRLGREHNRVSNGKYGQHWRAAVEKPSTEGNFAAI